MEKERKIKTISVIALIVAVLGLTVAFAVLSTNLVINGTAKVDPGKWDIHFEDLSKATLKGSAIAQGTATINTDNKTRIEGIDVTLTKPEDEVTYTVNIINGGNIDAEISDITGPDLSGDAQKYVEFSARYADKKDITQGDILKGGTTENVTISIKFKEEVIELPKDDLSITLSYEINYVQSNENVDNNVHKGEAKEESTPQIDYDSLNVGSEVTLGTESFYVIENNDTELKLLAKYNLLVGTRIAFDSLEYLFSFSDAQIEKIDYNTPGYGKQSEIAKGFDNDNTTWTGVTEFAKRSGVYDFGYWTDDYGTLKNKYGNDYPVNVYDDKSSLYQYVENYKGYLQELGYSIKEARLITFDELISLKCTGSSCDSAPSWVYETSYWTASAVTNSYIYNVDLDGSFNYHLCDVGEMYGIRPVIVIPKS